MATLCQSRVENFKYTRTTLATTIKLILLYAKDIVKL